MAGRDPMDSDELDRDDGPLVSGDSDNDDFQATTRSKVVANQPHDEEVTLSETDSFGPDDPPAMPKDASLIQSHDDDDDMSGGGPMPRGDPAPLAKKVSEYAATPQATKTGSVSDDATPPGGYNAMEYRHLNVPQEIRDVFEYIGRYKPQSIELDTKLKPFIPDYIPAIGGIDEFIKVPRPDAKPDFLGLKVLDEPAAKQSDPTVLTLQLRQHSKDAPGTKADMVGRIEHTDENKMKKISQWISSIGDIHKSKPAPVVSYSRRMPDIESLMQEWPPEMEQWLKTMKLPTSDMDLDLKTYSKMVCTLLDIPVYEQSVLESLHLLFSLYLEFKNNPLFRQHMDMENRLDMAANPQDGSMAGPQSPNVMMF